MKRRDALATVGALAVAGTHQVWAQQPIVIKFSHVVANDTPKGKGALKFKELAEKYTGGKVKVEVYPNSTLYKDKEEMDALNSGSVQILAPSTAKFRPIGVPEFEVMDLPYIFNGQAGYEKIVDGPIGKSLFKKLETKGITGLAYWDNGFHMVSANKPLLMPADFQGLKIRISGSKIADLYFRALGALPQIMAFSEVYQALQTGVLDAGFTGVKAANSRKFYEIQKYGVASNIILAFDNLVVNPAWWNGLPADVRNAIQQAADRAVQRSIGTSDSVPPEDVKVLNQKGMQAIALTKAQEKAMADAMQPAVKKEFLRETAPDGVKLLEMINRL